MTIMTLPSAQKAKRRRATVMTWMPAVLALVVSGTGLAEVGQRSQVLRADPAAAVVASRIVATPVPTPTPEPVVTPPPLVEATPVPSRAPRVRAAGSGARTAGPRIAAPVPAKGWVQIPAASTNAPMVRVGLDQDGNMVTPKNAKDIAWLDNGSFPGPTRNAILAGHRNWKGVQGSLVRLEKTQPGDVVRVGLDGKVYTFTITWVKKVHPETADHNEIMGSTPVDSVTLITCGGEFNRNTRHYEERIVARAELVGVEDA